jgi:hypothetical protein
VAEAELSPSAKWEEGGFLPRIPASLEQLDLLLIEELRPRKVRRDGIHFQGFRYVSLTLAAYVGEDVTVRFDPRDMAEIRVFFKDRFLCRAISAEIAGETVALRDIVRVRNSRRRELKSILDSRQKTVDVLLQLKKGQSIERTRISEPAATPQQQESSATETSDASFVETSEYRRFVEFCDACRTYRYIGLCYGPPGVGKTLSARRYSRADSLDRYDRWDEATMPPAVFDTVLYTAEVINTPSRIALDLSRARERLTGIAVRPIEREADAVLEEIRLRDEARRREILEKPGCSPRDRPAVDPAYFQTYQFYQTRKKEVSDPTTLIVVDEADRLQMNSLEQVRSIFEQRLDGHDFGRHAWHREAHSSLSAALLAHRIRTRVPSLE